MYSIHYSTGAANRRSQMSGGRGRLGRLRSFKNGPERSNQQAIIDKSSFDRMAGSYPKFGFMYDKV